MTRFHRTLTNHANFIKNNGEQASEKMKKCDINQNIVSSATIIPMSAPVDATSRRV